MKKKTIFWLCMSMVATTLISAVYLNKTNTSDHENLYLKTVVFKDKDDDLIPVVVNFNSQVEIEREVGNYIDFMKSDQLSLYGLLPILSHDLEVKDVNIQNHILTICFNDVFDKNDNMAVIEALTYTMTRNVDVQEVKFVVSEKNGDEHQSVMSYTKDLGLNNFVETSSFLHQTKPIMVYKEKQVNQFSYYVPTTMRIDENETLYYQVQTILNYINSKIHLIDASLKQGVLSVELDSNILLDNERIDKKMEDLIVLSLMSIKDVEHVEIIVNKEQIDIQKTSYLEYNYIKI